MITFEIKGEYIELIKLLKATAIAQSGAEAKELVNTGKVFLNNQVDLRLRAKVRKGDVVKYKNETIEVG